MITIHVKCCQCDVVLAIEANPPQVVNLNGMSMVAIVYDNLVVCAACRCPLRIELAGVTGYAMRTVPAPAHPVDNRIIRPS